MFNKYWRIGVLTVVLAMWVFLTMAVASEADIQTGIVSLNGAVFNLAKNALTGILFITILWEVIQGWMQKQMASKWMVIIGAAIFMVAINAAPKLYALLMNKSVSDVVDTSKSIDNL